MFPTTSLSSTFYGASMSVMITCGPRSRDLSRSPPSTRSAMISSSRRSLRRLRLAPTPPRPSIPPTLGGTYTQDYFHSSFWGDSSSRSPTPLMLGEPRLPTSSGSKGGSGRRRRRASRGGDGRKGDTTWLSLSNFECNQALMRVLVWMTTELEN